MGWADIVRAVVGLVWWMVGLVGSIEMGVMMQSTEALLLGVIAERTDGICPSSSWISLSEAVTES